MFIKHYREVTYRVPDPMHPGRNVFDRRMDSSKTHKLLHNGVEYDADTEGWFDVPDAVGQHFVNFPGWCTPEMVDEEVVAGRIRADAADKVPSTREKLEAQYDGEKPKGGKQKREPKAKSAPKSKAKAEEDAAAGVS